MRLAALALAAILLGGCQLRVDPVTLSAETAAILGEQALETNDQYVHLCQDRTLEASKCRAWAVWFRGFQRDYALAHEVFMKATAAGDVSTAREAAAQIHALAAELVLYAVGAR